MALNFNNYPYFDDFNPSDNYHRILFQPGYSVQARELTQSQTIIQNQITQFASAIYSQNTPISGGKVTTNLNCNYVILNSTYAGTNINIDGLAGQLVSDEFGVIIATILVANQNYGSSSIDATTGKVTGLLPTLVISYQSGQHFYDGMSVYVGGKVIGTTIGSPPATINSVLTKYTTSVGTSSVASISAGVYYVINGYTDIQKAGVNTSYNVGNFVNVLPQTIVLDAYDSIPSMRVGLNITESIVNSSTDISLLDPAIGASNFQAPGADRYKISLALENRQLTTGDDDQFIELVRIVKGSVVKQTDQTVYSAIDDYFSKRDFETNGDYIVNQFKFTPAPNSLGDADKYDLNIGKGVAYVHGYRIENQSNLILTSDRSRSTSTIQTNDVSISYGNYFYVDTINGFFDTTTQPRVDVHCVPSASIVSSSANTYASTLIGTTNIRNLQYVYDAGSASPLQYVYKAYLTGGISRNNLVGSVSSATSNTTFIINDSSSLFSTANNAYYNMQLSLTSGVGGSSGDIRTVNSYTVIGGVKTVVVNSPFTITPDSTSIFTLFMNSTNAESVVQTVGGGSYVLTANSNINTAFGKTSGIVTGNAILESTQNPEMLFTIGNPYVSGISGSSYTSTKNWRNKTFSGAGVLGPITIPTGTPLTFIGSGTLTSGNIKPYYTLIDTSTNQILNIDVGTAVVSVTQNNTQLTITAAGYAGKTVNIISTVNVTSADGTNGVLKAKNLVIGNSAALSTSNTVVATSNVDLTNGQVQITAVGAHAAKISLYVSDIKSISKIIDTGSPTTLPTLDMLTSKAFDVTAQYLLDNGQRDSFYDHASISLMPGAATARGILVVVFDRYAHTGGGAGDGYFSVLSYTSTNGGISSNPEQYNNIPSYTAKSGKVYSLADSLDFRPVRASAQSNGTFEYALSTASDGGVLLPTDLSQFQSTYSYYLARKDILILSKDKSFQIIEGTPSTNPIFPSEPVGALVLAKLELEPYTAYIPGENPSGTRSNLSINTIPHNRWAKSDITDLQSRVNNLEYYTALSVLEQNAHSLQIPDANGFNRFKNGILVDDFSSYSTADTGNMDFTSNINIRTQKLSPITLVDNFQLQNPIVLASLGTVTGTNTFAINSIKGTHSNIYTLPYTANNIIVQQLASSTVSLNPFAVTIYQGTAELYPPMDNWVDTTQNPAILSANPGMQVSQQTNGVNVINAGDFAIIPGTTSSTTSTASNSVTNHGAFNGIFGGQVGYTATTTTTSTYSSVLSNISNSIPASTSLNVNNGYLTNISILPYIRPQQIGLNVSGLLINTPISTWFDGTNIDRYISSCETIELANVVGTGEFSAGDIVGTYVSPNFKPIARVEGVYNYPGTTNVRLYVSTVLGSPTYSTSTSIQNGQYDASGSYSGTTASGSLTVGVSPIHTGGQVTAVGGTYTLNGAGTTGSIYQVQDPNDWCSFLNQYGVWGDLNQSATYSASFTVNFPVAGNYTFGNAVDNSAIVYLNGTQIINNNSGSSFTSPIYPVIYVAAGDHTISWTATNTGGPAGFALTIKDPSSNMIFSSTNPPGITYNNNNIAGAVELVMPLGGAWFTGVRAIALDQNSSSINGYYNGAEINVTSKYVYQYTLNTATYVAPAPPVASWGGGGGGGGTIICTKLFELGLLDKRIYDADAAFGKMVFENNPKVYEGYIRWASIVVDWMNGSGPDIMFWIKDDERRKSTQQEMVTRWTQRIATPWAEHMAYKMGAIEKDNKLGKFIMAVGFPVCKVANLLINNKKPGILVGYGMWVLFSVLYSISTLFQKENK